MRFLLCVYFIYLSNFLFSIVVLVLLCQLNRNHTSQLQGCFSIKNIKVKIYVNKFIKGVVLAMNISVSDFAQG